MSRAIKIPATAIVDTGYWYALYTPRDSLHKEAQGKAHHIERLRILLPWPTLYETVRTRFVKDRLAIDQFERLIKKPNIEFIDDTPYRIKALAATFEEARLRGRAISLCDMLVRLVLLDTNVRTDALLTFNVRDFHDVCRIKGVQIL